MNRSYTELYDKHIGNITINNIRKKSLAILKYKTAKYVKLLHFPIIYAVFEITFRLSPRLARNIAK